MKDNDLLLTMFKQFANFTSPFTSPIEYASGKILFVDWMSIPKVDEFGKKSLELTNPRIRFQSNDEFNKMTDEEYKGFIEIFKIIANYYPSGSQKTPIRKN